MTDTPPDLPNQQMAAKDPPVLYVDADACPVKEEIYRVADRYQLFVVLVSNSGMRIPLHPRISQIVVSDAKLDAADDWIADHIARCDIAVTNDIPLAARCVAAGGFAVSPTGTVFDKVSIGQHLATRDLMTSLRETGMIQSGGKPMGKSDRSKFLNALDMLVNRSRRLAKTPAV